MKSVRIVDMEIRNPNYEPQKALAARLGRGTYDEPVFLVLKAGTIIEGTRALLPCLLPEPKAVPFDAECREAVLASIHSETMRDKMEAYRQAAATPEAFARLPRHKQAMVRFLIDKWDGSQLQKLVLGESQLPEIGEPYPDAEAI